MNLAYRRYGTGAPLLLLHGLFGSQSNWSSVAQALADSFTVYTVDLRNHGRSPHTDVMAYGDMAHDVLHLMNGESLGVAAVLGHSMGGKVAMTLALQSPERVSALIAVDIAPVAYAPRFVNLLEALQAVPLHTITHRAHADELLAVSISEPRLRGFLLQNLVFTGGAYRWRINLPAIMQQVDTIFGFPSFPAGTVFSRPTLLLRGAWSNFVLPEHEPAIFSYFPMATIQSIADAGHWLQAEQPETLLAALRTFLDHH